ncbi:hypothetical protein Pmani_028372 [Petrolisthes manimaculis]|uniref:Uncharacterized protein n=1 Tax=Petrolisthes manimaculis TaxID=1843537 RepID=A0AAE1TUX6_9EUCA|nr:hypothetical protein Pmani_028372 [Petrolisthes manimaculis]
MAIVLSESIMVGKEPAGDVEEDESVPDRSEDIKPQFHKSTSPMVVMVVEGRRNFQMMTTPLSDWNLRKVRSQSI